MYKPLLIAFLLLVAGCTTEPSHTPSTHQHSFEDAERWAQVFDDPARDAWQKPDEVLKALALPPDAIVADIGAGTGYFSVRLAAQLPRGHVYAADVELSMVRHLAERAARENLRNLIPVHAQVDTPGLPTRADVVLLVDTYHHLEGRERYFRGLRELLTPSGRVAIIDFRADSPIGPPKHLRMAPAQVEAEMKAAGYVVAARHDFLPRQYFLVFRPEVAK